MAGFFVLRADGIAGDGYSAVISEPKNSIKVGPAEA